MNKQLYLDMDGVLVDFIGGALARHNSDTEFYYATHPDRLGRWIYETDIAANKQQFWEKVNVPGFWVGLRPTRESSDLVFLVGELFGIDRTAILTAPSDDPKSITEKQNWVAKYFPEYKLNMIFAPGDSKKLVAGPGRILIDDSDTNVRNWALAGGTGILFPRPWNTNYSNPNPLGYVMDKLGEALAG